MPTVTRMNISPSSLFRSRNNELGDFMNGVGLPLAEAILSVERNEHERAQLAQKLKKWERGLSDYGMEEGLELGIQAAEYGWSDAPPRRAPPPRRVALCPSPHAFRSSR